MFIVIYEKLYFIIDLFCNLIILRRTSDYCKYLAIMIGKLANISKTSNFLQSLYINIEKIFALGIKVRLRRGWSKYDYAFKYYLLCNVTKKQKSLHKKKYARFNACFIVQYGALYSII